MSREKLYEVIGYRLRWNKQGRSEEFDSCSRHGNDRPCNIIQIGLKSSIFRPVSPWNLMDYIEKQSGCSSMFCQALCIISKPFVNSNWSYSPETPNSGQNRWFFFVPCDLEIWRMALKNDRAPLLCYVKLCASFHSHQWIQTAVQKILNSGKNRWFFCRMGPWKYRTAYFVMDTTVA